MIFFTKKWPAAILDVQNSLSMAFLAISDEYKTFFSILFYKMATGAHFGCPKFTFECISSHFRSICNYNLFFIFDKMTAVDQISVHFRSIRNLIFFFNKMAAGANFGCPKFTFGRISGHFRSICNFNFFWKFLTKWLPSAILDV